MGRFLTKLNQFRADLARYYIDEKEILYRKNFKMLKDVSLIVSAMTTLMILVTPFVISTWSPTLQHFGFAILSVILWFILSFIEKYNKVTRRLTSIMCFIGGVLLFSFIILIDIFPYTNDPSQFIQTAVIIIPLLFVTRFWRIYSFIITFQVIDMVMLLQFKNRHMAQNDILSSIKGLLISLTTWWFITKLRVDNHIIQNRYRTLSMTDSLTGILNKGACIEKIHLCLQEAADKDECCVLLFMDIDNYKKINDSYGHQMGDSILEQFGGRLVRCFRSTDIVGRFGGDEFLVFLRGIQSIQDVNKRCDELQEALSGIHIEEFKGLSCSIGISVTHKGCYDFDQLFKIADQALYKAKFSGKKKYVMGDGFDSGYLK